MFFFCFLSNFLWTNSSGGFSCITFGSSIWMKFLILDSLSISVKFLILGSLSISKYFLIFGSFKLDDESTVKSTWDYLYVSSLFDLLLWTVWLYCLLLLLSKSFKVTLFPLFFQNPSFYQYLCVGTYFSPVRDHLVEDLFKTLKNYFHAVCL